MVPILSRFWRCFLCLTSKSIHLQLTIFVRCSVFFVVSTIICHFKVSVNQLMSDHRLFLCRSIPSATFSQFNMPLSDIIDDDLVKYQRRWDILILITRLPTSFSVDLRVKLVVAGSRVGFQTEDPWAESESVRFWHCLSLCFLSCLFVVLTFMSC